MRGKRGWLRILEATIAVLIVSGAIMAVYSQRSVEGRFIAVEFFSSLQNEILDDIVMDADLRLAVLKEDEVLLNSFVGQSIPLELGYLLRVCNLSVACKMDDETFIETMDKDIFVEETIISSEVGDGSDPIYSPKKVRLFVWEE